MNDGDGAIIAAAIVGGITILATWITIKDNNQRKKDEIFFKALDFLGGGSQKRNLGVAAIELSLKSEKHQALSVSLLIGSAIYLLKESKQEDSSHELYNLSRIMTILLEAKSVDLTKNNALLKRNYELLIKTIWEVKKQKADHVEPHEVKADVASYIQDIFSAEEQLHEIVKKAKAPDSHGGLKVSLKDLTAWEEKLSGLFKN